MQCAVLLVNVAGLLIRLIAQWHEDGCPAANSIFGSVAQIFCQRLMAHLFQYILLNADCNIRNKETVNMKTYTVIRTIKTRYRSFDRIIFSCTWYWLAYIYFKVSKADQLEHRQIETDYEVDDRS